MTSLKDAVEDLLNHRIQASRKRSGAISAAAFANA